VMFVEVLSRAGRGGIATRRLIHDFCPQGCVKPRRQARRPVDREVDEFCQDRLACMERERALHKRGSTLPTPGQSGSGRQAQSENGLTIDTRATTVSPASAADRGRGRRRGGVPRPGDLVLIGAAALQAAVPPIVAWSTRPLSSYLRGLICVLGWLCFGVTVFWGGCARGRPSPSRRRWVFRGTPAAKVGNPSKNRRQNDQSPTLTARVGIPRRPRPGPAPPAKVGVPRHPRREGGRSVEKQTPERPIPHPHREGGQSAAAAGVDATRLGSGRRDATRDATWGVRCGCGRHLRRPTSSSSVPAAPSGRGRATSGWRCRSRHRSRTLRRR